MKFGFLSIALFSVTMLSAQSESEKLKAKAFAAADKTTAKCIEWRHDFHQNPELGNREFRTSKIIAEHLKKLGIETKENVAKTGVVGILRGAKSGPCIALRADIDALPVIERVNLPWASKQKQTRRSDPAEAMWSRRSVHPEEREGEGSCVIAGSTDSLGLPW